MPAPPMPKSAAGMGAPAQPAAGTRAMPGPPAMPAPGRPPAAPDSAIAPTPTTLAIDAMLDAMRAASGEIDLAQLVRAPQPVLPNVVRNFGAARRFYFLPDAPPQADYVPMPDTGPGSGLGNCAYEGIEIATDA